MHISTSCTSSWTQNFPKTGSVQHPQTKITSRTSDSVRLTRAVPFLPFFVQITQGICTPFFSLRQKELLLILCVQPPSSPGDTANKPELCCAQVKSFINQLLKSVYFCTPGQARGQLVRLVHLYDHPHLFLCSSWTFPLLTWAFFDLTHDQSHFLQDQRHQCQYKVLNNLSHTFETDPKPFNVAHI